MKDYFFYLITAFMLLTFSFTSCEKGKNDDVVVRGNQMTLTTEANVVSIGLAGSGAVSIDWGDGTKIEIVNTITSDTSYFWRQYTKASLRTITITGADITYLICENNSLTNLDVSKNTALTNLQCRVNQLTNLDVSRNTALTTLHCDWNQLTNLDVSKNTALTTLLCEGNDMTNLDVSKNIALTYLYCHRNRLMSLDASNNTALTILWCEDNNLISLDVSGCRALSVMSCSMNRLKSLDVTENTVLTTLCCNYNRLKSLDMSNNTTLKTLSCHSNDLSNVGIDLLFGSLHNNSISGKILDVSNNPGTEDCDMNITEEKGWTVILVY